ncbi:MAG TPA: hypothetical protein VF950_17180 [Planctomycetota bacterium]
MNVESAAATPEAAEAAQRLARRIVFMSKGLMMAAAGAWMCLLGGTAWLAAGWPAAKPYAYATSLAAGLALAFLNVGIERSRARKDCHVRTLRKGTAREHATLAGVIVGGVAVLVALGLALPGLFEQPWIGPAALALLVCAFGGTFFVWAGRSRLYELALIGAGMVAACGIAFYFGRWAPLSERGFETLLRSMQAGFGALLLAAGLSLHGRWVAWCARTLAETEREAS